MNLRVTQSESVDAPPAVKKKSAAPMKFVYPSGSRPLNGYTIKRGIGRGGFGEVYFAISDAGKEVALKLIRSNLEVELRGVTQCLNLKHRNLIGLYDIRTGEEEDQWVIMEYVSGGSLEEEIDQHPQGMPIDKVLWWMRGLCEGVSYLHNHGIVHRDLKPGNIFSDEGVVKIGDYGLAKFISCSRRSGQTESVGTVHYMAPEISGGRYGREIDTYALGIILYELLTGNVPFAGESVGEVLMKHLTAEPDLSPLKEPYRDIVRRALAKDPDVRLGSASEMLALLDGEVGSVKQEPPVIPAAVNEPEPRTEPSTWAEVEEEPIEEPLFKAIREWVFRLRELGNSRNIQPLGIAIIIFSLLFLGIPTIRIWMPLLVFMTICYGFYYIFWMALIRPGIRHHAKRSRQAPTPPSEAASAADPIPTGPKPKRHHKPPFRKDWLDRANQQLLAKPLREKFTELLGSMLLAALVAMLAALVTPLAIGSEPFSEQIALYLWLAIVGTLGSWAILVPTKFFEGKIEDQAPMRGMLLILGAAVGIAAWGLGEALLLNFPHGSDPMQINDSWLTYNLFHWKRPPNGANPSLAVYITYFASLFVLLRWWRQAEYTRHRRLSLWTVSVCLFCAWLIHFFWWFPQPMGMMVAGVIAISTQLASPWLPPSRRQALAEKNWETGP